MNCNSGISRKLYREVKLSVHEHDKSFSTFLCKEREGEVDCLLGEPSILYIVNEGKLITFRGREL